jgi:hypothetical protein
MPEVQICGLKLGAVHALIGGVLRVRGGLQHNFRI